ncbi:MAG: lysophospholipid acyltransferase family protein [candidate division KSB1 bacterium]|nr:lysophospholipid acyltransferase family protein [candidate division KSB1 bacterium]
MSKKTRKHRIEYTLTRGVARLVQSLSPDTAVRAGRILGRFVYHIIPLRKDVALDNLRKSFPQRTERELRGILLRTYQHFGQTFTEFMRTPIRSEQEMKNRVVMKNPRVLKDALSMKKGTILMTGHFGNWEIMGAAIATLYTPLAVLAKAQRNASVDKMINEYRTAAHIETVPLGLAVRGVLKALRQGKAMALLADQNAKKDSIFVPFLGRKAATAPGPALFALKTGAPVVFGACVMRKDGCYSVIYERLKTDDIQGVSEENIRILTERHVQTLERFIQRYPDHWFWMHKRWRTRPPEEKKDRT